MAAGVPVDVTGRPTELRDLDLSGFFAPADGGPHRSVGQPGTAQRGHDREAAGLGRGARRRRSTSSTRTGTRSTGGRACASIGDLPGRRRPGGDPGGRRRRRLRGRAGQGAPVRGHLLRRFRRDRRRRSPTPGEAGTAGGHGRDPPARTQHEPERLRVLHRGRTRAGPWPSSPRAATRAGPSSRPRTWACGCRPGPPPATRSTSSSPTSPAGSPTSPKSGSSRPTSRDSRTVAP